MSITITVVDWDVNYRLQSSIVMERSDFGTQSFSGTRLRELREDRGLSRQQLAQKAEPPLSRAYIYLLEGDATDTTDGARRPSYDVVLRLAKALDVSPDAFYARSLDLTQADSDAPEAIPVPLQDAADRFKIPESDVHELARLTFRGRRPQKAADWAQLWMAILSSIGSEL